MVRDVSREQQLQSMRKDFVANASHELRSPLTVITGYLDALADDQKLDATWSAPILEMRRQAERMSTIINDLLELSKLESGDRPLDEEPVDVPGMLALLRKETLAIEQRPREVKLTLDSDAWLKGVENELHSIVSNLLSNAVKYTPVHGEVELRWWTDDEGGHICGARHWSRHRAGAYSAPHGAFLPRRFRALARPRRLGAGTCDRAACAAAARCNIDDRKCRRSRQQVHVSFPRAAGRAAAGRLRAGDVVGLKPTQSVVIAASYFRSQWPPELQSLCNKCSV